MPLTLRAVLRDLGAAMALYLLASAAMFAVAPIGGGVYHLVFAYSDGGRVGTALFVFGAHALVLGLFAAAILALELTRGWWLGIVAAVIGTGWSWGITSYPGASAAFRSATYPALALVPVGILLLTVPGILLQARASARAQAGGRALGPRGRLLAWALLLSPLLGLGLLFAGMAFYS